tara:strand:- start:3757 stop:4560 length:804 start_codon:yes stop_codon:yes gene_type:complete
MALKLDPLTKKLTTIPDSVFQGPLLKYKVEYKKMVKRIRRGESGIVEEAQDYGMSGVDAYKGERVTEEDMGKIKDTIAKITNFVVGVGGTIGKVIVAVKSFKLLKDGLANIAKLSEKASLIAAASAPGITGGPPSLIAWLQRKIAQLAMATAYTAANILILILKWESRLMKYAGGIIGVYALAIKFYAVSKSLRAVRAEKWGRGSHNDVVKAQQEAKDADAYADDQENKFYKDVRGSGAFDDTIFQEDEEMDLEYEDVLKYDVTYGE